MYKAPCCVQSVVFTAIIDTESSATGVTRSSLWFRVEGCDSGFSGGSSAGVTNAPRPSSAGVAMMSWLP